MHIFVLHIEFNLRDRRFRCNNINLSFSSTSCRCFPVNKSIMEKMHTSIELITVCELDDR